MKRLTFLGLVLALAVLLVGCSPAEKVEEVYLDLATSSFSEGIVTTERDVLALPYSFLRDYLAYQVIAPLAEPLVIKRCSSPPEAYQPKPQFTMHGGEILRYKGETRETPDGPSYLFEVKTTGVLEWSPTVWEAVCRWGYWVCKGETYARRFELELPEVWIHTYFTRPGEEYFQAEVWLGDLVDFGDPWEDYFQTEVWLGDTTNVLVDFGDPMFLPTERVACPQLCQDP